MDESGTVPKYIWSYFYTQEGLMMSNAQICGICFFQLFQRFHFPPREHKKAPREPFPGGLLPAPADSCMEFGKN